MSLKWRLSNVRGQNTQVRLRKSDFPGLFRHQNPTQDAKVLAKALVGGLSLHRPAPGVPLAQLLLSQTTPLANVKGPAHPCPTHPPEVSKIRAKIRAMIRAMAGQTKDERQGSQNVFSQIDPTPAGSRMAGLCFQPDLALAESRLGRISP